MNRKINDVPVLNPENDVLKYIFPSDEGNDIAGNVPYCVDSAKETETGCDFDLCNKTFSYR